MTTGDWISTLSEEGLQESVAATGTFYHDSHVSLHAHGYHWNSCDNLVMEA